MVNPQKIKNCVAEGKTEKAIELLMVFAEGTDKANQVIHLKGRHVRIKDKDLKAFNSCLSQECQISKSRWVLLFRQHHLLLYLVVLCQLEK